MARNAAGKKLFNNTLLTIKLFIMNKRFFTLMAAVMLAGSPFASEAFAADPEPAVITGNAASAVALGNNVKFIILSAVHGKPHNRRNCDL